MKTVKIIIGRKNNCVEKGIVSVRSNGRVTNAIAAYGTALQATYHDIAGISNRRGYVWVGHTGDPAQCPEMLAWTDLSREGDNRVTWDIL